MYFFNLFFTSNMKQGTTLDLIIHVYILISSATIRLRTPLRSSESWNRTPGIVHFTSQHSDTRSSDGVLHQSPTVPHGGQITVHSISQNGDTRSSDRVLHQSTQRHMAIRSCISPVNTVPHCGQIIVHFFSQHSATRQSDRAFH